MTPSLRLRDQGLMVRIALSCVVLVLAGGYAAALYHLRHHVAAKDDEPAFTWLDLEGTYRGVEKPAPLLAVLDDAKHRKTWAKDLTDREAELLRTWLSGKLPTAPGAADKILAAYDNLPPGAPEETPLPADVIDQRCVRCHAPGVKAEGDLVPGPSLKTLPELKPYLYRKSLSPISTEILAVSTHTHAPSMAFMALVAGGLVLATGFRRRLRHVVALLLGVGLLLDLGGMWLARLTPLGLPTLVAGGALFGLGFALALLLAVVDLWRPVPRRG